MNRWRTRLFLDTLDERIVPDATPLTNPSAGITQAPYPTDAGTTTPVNFLMADPPAPTPGPVVPTPGGPGPTMPAPPNPQPGTSPRELTDAERTELAALAKAIEAANKTLADINTLKAGLVADRDKQLVTLNLLKDQLKLAREKFEGLRDFLAQYTKRFGAHAGDTAYADILNQIAEARGAVNALEIAVAIAKKPVDDLQQRINNCDKAITDIKAQITAMKVRVADIILAAAAGKDSGPPPVFTPIIFTPPNASPTPAPTTVP